MSSTSTSSSSNPRKYIIYESSQKITDCPSSSYVASYVSSTGRKQGDTSNTPLPAKTLAEVSQYIVENVNDFLNQYQLASRCEQYRIGSCNPFSNISIPSDCSVFSNFQTKQCTTALTAYPTYLATNVKSLCQKEKDLISLLDNFSTIVSSLPAGQDKSTMIANLQTTNQQLRDKLDSQLVELKNSPFLRDNQLRLDTTIYTTALWAILATSALYYAFLKM